MSLELSTSQREKDFSWLLQQGASGTVPVFSDPVSAGEFSSSPGGWAANVHLRKWKAIEKGETELAFYFLLSRMLSRKIPVSLTQKSSSLSVNLVKNLISRINTLENLIFLPQELWWPRFPLLWLLTSFSNGGFRKTRVILALIMWSHILTVVFLQMNIGKSLVASYMVRQETGMKVQRCCKLGQVASSLWHFVSSALD